MIGFHTSSTGDPRSTGFVAESEASCQACGEARGYIYTGHVYGPEDLEEAICPWCIADGSAASRFEATFTDDVGIGGYGRWEQVPRAVIEEISTRTPGFTGWQQEQWWTHCGDAAAYVGRAGQAELARDWPGAIPALKRETGYDDQRWEKFFPTLDAEGSPCAYIFRCLHCGAFGAYSDYD